MVTICNNFLNTWLWFIFIIRETKSLECSWHFLKVLFNIMYSAQNVIMKDFVTRFSFLSTTLLGCSINSLKVPIQLNEIFLKSLLNIQEDMNCNIMPVWNGAFLIFLGLTAVTGRQGILPPLTNLVFLRSMIAQISNSYFIRGQSLFSIAATLNTPTFWGDLNPTFISVEIQLLCASCSPLTLSMSNWLYRYIEEFWEITTWNIDILKCLGCTFQRSLRVPPSVFPRLLQ
jgi:hypothetical protein